MNNKKRAISLGEVLIVLLLLGVLALLAMNYLRQTVENKKIVAYKKSVSILTDAIKDAVEDYKVCAVIEDSEDLATCIGTDRITASQDVNTLIAADGMSYTFFWRKGAKGSIVDCNSGFGKTQDDWEGTNANCVVVINIAKRNEDVDGVNDLTAKTKITQPANEKQFPMIITHIGLQPVYYEGALGYEYTFGVKANDENKKPWENNLDDNEE